MHIISCTYIFQLAVVLCKLSYADDTLLHDDDDALLLFISNMSVLTSSRADYIYFWLREEGRKRKSERLSCKS